MKNSRIYLAMGWSVLGLTAACSGCAMKHPALGVSPPPAEALRAQFGTMGVTATGSSPRLHYFPLPKQKGELAAAGAWKGFKSGLDMPMAPSQRSLIIPADVEALIGTPKFFASFRRRNPVMIPA